MAFLLLRVAGADPPGVRSRATEHGWSVAVLEHQILSSLHTRTGAAPNNLEARLAGEGSALAREIAKDPLVLDFLGLTEEAEEHAIEEAMTLRMSQTLADSEEDSRSTAASTTSTSKA